MKKNFKRFISLLLTVLMLMSVMSVGASAEDTTQAPVAEESEEDHRYLFEVFIDFWVEVFEFFKYIFYDVFRGDPVT